MTRRVTEDVAIERGVGGGIFVNFLVNFERSEDWILKVVSRQRVSLDKELKSGLGIWAMNAGVKQSVK